mgnify:CR=1 FL=1
MPFGQWHSEAQITAEDVAKGESIKDLIDTLAKDDYIALLDRNDHEADLRKVFLRRDGDNSYTLHDEHGNLLDEPEFGCRGCLVRV